MQLLNDIQPKNFGSDNVDMYNRAASFPGERRLGAETLKRIINSNREIKILITPSLVSIIIAE